MVELLAPSGNFESLYSAVENSADAVYLGLKKFSARNFAKNFDLEDIPYIREYLYVKSKKLYITINTLIKETEIKELFEILEKLNKFKVDAIIFQDLSIIKLVNEYFPELNLHASTQLTNINSYDVKFLEPYVKRVILERQLYLTEIEKIAKNSNIEIECFIHGALCYSISGQCLFSSYLGGFSGNRGKCTQPCRRLYYFHNKKGYYFSTNDLSSVNVLQKLIEAGVSSLKIEGRMKSAYYVGNIVKAYRILIDDYYKNKKISEEAIKEAKEYIKESYGRKTSPAFYSNKLPDIVEPKLSGNTGIYTGKILEKSNSIIKFKTIQPIHLLDRIRIQSLKEDEKRLTLKVKEILKNGRKIEKARPNDIIEIPLNKKFTVRKGDLVFKIQSIKSKIKLKDEESAKRIIKNNKPKLQVKINGEYKNNSLKFYFNNSEFSYPVNAFTAKNTELNSAIILKYFKPKFEKENLNLKIDFKPAKIVVPQKELKDIASNLAKEIKYLTDNKKILPEINEDKIIKIPPERYFYFKIKSIEDIIYFPDNFKDHIIIPVHPHIEKLLNKFSKKIEKLKNFIIFEINDLIFEKELFFWQEKINFLKDKGFFKFFLNYKYEYNFFNYSENVFLMASEKFHISNTISFEFLKNLGFSKIILDIENDKLNLQKFYFKLDAVIPLFSYISLMKSRIPNTIKKSSTLKDYRKNETYYFKVKKDFFELLHTEPFVITYHLEDLYNLGYRNFFIDISNYLKYKNNLPAIIRNFKKGISPVKGRDFNYTLEWV